MIRCALVEQQVWLALVSGVCDPHQSIPQAESKRLIAKAHREALTPAEQQVGVLCGRLFLIVVLPVPIRFS